jgi:ABC-type uncharacterized transport system permease subunit
MTSKVMGGIARVMFGVLSIGLVMLFLKRTRAYRDVRAGGEKKGIADPAGFASFWSVCALLCAFVTCLAGLIMCGRCGRWTRRRG